MGRLDMDVNARGGGSEPPKDPEAKAHYWLDVVKQIAGPGVVYQILKFVANKFLTDSKKGF